MHSDTLYLRLGRAQGTVSSMAVLERGCETATVGNGLQTTKPSVRRMISRFSQGGRLRMSYEDGSTDYQLPRLLRRLGVVAVDRAVDYPDRALATGVKTDDRDCRPAKLHRAGGVVAIRFRPCGGGGA